MFKGQRYWLRCDVTTLHPVRQWGRLMRQVRVSEKDKPAKIVSKTVRKKTSNGVADTGKVHRNLYGEWQTEPITVEPIRGDVIPTNEYGKIEIWDYNTLLVPEGACFLSGLQYSLQDIRAACKAMELPFADALVGFDHKAGGLTVPTVGGVVVLHKHQSIIKAALEDLGDRKDMKKEEKRQKRALANWKRLVSLAVLREKVKSKFNDVA